MNATQETWAPIAGYENHYEVSDHGRIRSLPRYINSSRCQRLIPGIIRKQYSRHYGHRMVSLSRGGCATPFMVHRLVLETFVGRCPDGMECCHNDGDASNNHLSNLRWDTSKANKEDIARHGTRRSMQATHCKRGHRLNPAKKQCQKCDSILQWCRYHGKPTPPYTHCNYGHVRSPENVYVRSDGKARCKECLRQRQANAALRRTSS